MPHPKTYKDYVEALCPRYPSLLTLYGFLSNPRARRQSCRVSALDFQRGSPTPTARQIGGIDHLSSELLSKADISHGGSEDDHSQPLQGRMLVIEDLTVEIIELLGSELDIDPLFFAMHLHTVQRKAMRHPIPNEATLPSRLLSQNYLNAAYHCPVTYDNADLAGRQLVGDTAIDRKVVFLRSTTVGLAARQVSIIKIRRSNGLWLALTLVDPPLGDVYFTSGHKEDATHKVQLILRPFLGAYEDFADPPKFSENWNTLNDCPRGGMLDDVVQRWQARVPACFNREDPTIQSLAYYPLKIVAAEWVKYHAVMRHCIKQYEYRGNQLPDLDKFNADLRELQGWQRRSTISQEKIKLVIRNLRSQNSLGSRSCAAMDHVIKDFEVINSNIETAGARLENMLPVVTSLVSIIDARQNFAETLNISRLTVLALIFVPLSYVSSLFSMNPDNMPGSPHFWVYFAVAVPVTTLVFIVARPPHFELQSALAWICRLWRPKRKSEPPAEIKSAQAKNSKTFTWFRGWWKHGMTPDTSKNVKSVEQDASKA
ncbi:hypothetical protein P153DRAFT_387515 [Dothidotthia symphoricarpi CBS 119687]|uniref:Cora-domain-containing protein n=1 Tax=Dothidotthia symphoricarpi CBS 119687 TaxID=1392245 RepID=A0A6A6AAQ9_9PLEO|nr:uncharacterized protein P153DRAFT_387515 [Dothidotthia symphoricarpi CBS 119687]KAF2127781.1 hypothetical protein P153DRAFT_387515 [Dothidotthia symphoricarpi CBS 119687]